MLRKFASVLLMFTIITGGCVSREDSSASHPQDEISESALSNDSSAGFSESVPEIPEPEPEPIPLKRLEFTVEQARQLFEPDAEGIVELASPRDMAALAALVNGGDEWYRSYTFRLKNDINLAGIDFIPIGGTDEEGNGYSFEATFDGGGHVIRDLTIRESGFSSGTGLFGSVGTNGTVKSIHVIGGEVLGEVYTGGIVGLLGGSLSGCSYRGEVTGVNDVGGLFGAAITLWDNPSVVRESASNAIVKGASSVGGLGGTAAVGVIISDCYALGTATIIEHSDYERPGEVAGLLGHNGAASLRNCFALVEVYTKVHADFVGSFIGYNAGEEVVSCYYADYLNSWKGVCFEAHDVNPADVTGCAVDEITERETFRDWDFDNVWGISEDKNRGLPYLISVSG